MKRLNPLEYAMQLAHAVAARSTCIDKQVGCVLMDKYGRVVGTGYNGAPRGCKQCCDSNKCVKQYGSHCPAVHAEANALLMAKPEDVWSCYCTLAPCYECVKLLLNTSCQRVYYATPAGPKHDIGRKLWTAVRSDESWIHLPNSSTL